MFLWWGPDLICFYNDAYRPSLGDNGKHPALLGKRAEDGWAEIWSFLQPRIEQIMTGGESIWAEDQLVPIERNGQLENVWWTYSYSPVHDETGNVNGVLVVCTETTGKVHLLQQLQDRELYFRNLFSAAPIATALFEGPEFIVSLANEEALKLWGKKGDVIGRKVLDVMPELEGQPFIKLLQDVYTTGSLYEGKEDLAYLEKDGQLEEVYVNFIYKAIHNPEGKITGIITMGFDVTDQVLSKKKMEEAERRYRELIKTLPVAVYTVDKNGYIDLYNEACLELWGRAPKKGEDKWTGFEAVYDLDENRLRPENYPIAQSMQEDRYIVIEAYMQRPDGSMRHVIAHPKPIHDGAGKVAGAMNVLIDITDRKLAENALQVSEEKFRSLARLMPQLIWTMDAQHRLTYYSQSLSDYTGLTPRQIDQDGYIQFVHPDDRKENIRKWAQCLRSGENFLFEHRYRRHDGAYRWYLSRAIPQKDPEGKIQMWVGTSTDIDEIKQHEQQKDDFIKVASHELKTPITTIKGYVQLLLREEAAGANTFLQQSLSTIDKQVSRLTRLVDDLLDVTRIDMGSFRLNTTLLPIGGIVKEVIEDLQATTPAHSFLLEQYADPVVCLDRDRIQQVLVNLFNNAVKYSPHADKVIVSIRQENAWLTLSVQDFGIGIAPNDQEKIFTRFYRVSGRDEKTVPGFGIGLFIVREIINLHGGTVGVESEKGRGSTFYFSLPVS